ncbi:sensor histidine kinase [Synoicihabitans lomoniglobus]|uniref:Histidine kinase n=1 Tax=Synoicihabitans lomoniglobus TaxID=2909285 RepID=A0AAE9ZZL1_9BACT|nr:histidine kinase [Opitutaceae bacterium LMO-M01]WED63517.1 histidine kinase [Opitutaceae bacterium LMO-M01]
MAPSETRSSPRNPWWHYALVVVGAIGLMCVLLPSPPGQSRFTPIYIGRLAVMSAAVAITISFNVFVLLPKLAHRRRFVMYYIALLLLVYGAGHGIYAANGFVMEQITGRPARYPSPKAKMVVVFFNQVLVFTALSSVLHYLRSWARSRELERQKLEAELTALKAQLNPHFLFNSLNNIYSLALDKSDDGPAYVLKMSEMMRYILHDSQVESIELRKELEFVQHYLDLERIRTENTMRMTLNVQGDPEGVQVAPLLFLPFVENAFKHGVSTAPVEAFVEINASVLVDGHLVVEVINSKEDMEAVLAGMGITPPAPASEMPGGIGLENVRRRLHLLYPDRHDLVLRDEGDRFVARVEVWS